MPTEEVYAIIGLSFLKFLVFLQDIKSSEKTYKRGIVALYGTKAVDFTGLCFISIDRRLLSGAVIEAKPV